MKYLKPQETVWMGEGMPPSGMLTTGKEQAEYLLGDVSEVTTDIRSVRPLWAMRHRPANIDFH